MFPKGRADQRCWNQRNSASSSARTPHSIAWRESARCGAFGATDRSVAFLHFLFHALDSFRVFGLLACQFSLLIARQTSARLLPLNTIVTRLGAHQRLLW